MLVFQYFRVYHKIYNEIINAKKQIILMLISWRWVGNFYPSMNLCWCRWGSVTDHPLLSWAKLSCECKVDDCRYSCASIEQVLVFFQTWLPWRKIIFLQKVLLLSFSSKAPAREIFWQNHKSLGNLPLQIEFNGELVPGL